MSKRRSVILSVVLEGRTQAQTARLYGVSEGWVSKLVARWRAEGDAAFQARSRSPGSSPTKVSDETVEMVVNLRSELSSRGLDAGPHTIAWHLQQRHQITVSPSTIRRRLVDLGLVEPNAKKRPKSSYVRFQADLPNQMWQSDFTHWRLATGADTEIITWLDDHSRYALSVTVHWRITGPIVVDTFNQTCADHGVPASTLTDNAMVYTTRFSGGKGGRNAFEARLAALDIEQKNSTPNHPTTCGKVERFQQTLKKYLTAQPRAHSLDQLQGLLNEFVDTYNNHRPHRSLRRSTPTAVYNRLPKATPEHNGADIHFRVRHDRIDKTGSVTLRHNSRLHHIGIGRAHKHTPVTLLIADLDIRVVATQTGELLRHLTLDPTRDYQPQNQP